MNIAFFTEMNFTGKIPRDHTNMRTEFAWMCALEADHWNINDMPDKSYDLGIVIIPKNNPMFELSKCRTYCNKVAVMQEGPNWLWQDYSLEQQIWYYNTLISADIIYTHNKSDQQYYKGLTNHPDVRVMPSLMIEDLIHKNIDRPRNGVMIGGNMTSWYGGFDSYIIAQQYNSDVSIPSMGRRIQGEEQMENLNHLPYMEWVNWIGFPCYF